jgi:carbamoyl-phosphate synthase large subunit
MNILVLSVSRKVQLISSLKDACSTLPIKIFCADSSEESAALYFGDGFVILPKTNDNSFMNTVINYCKDNNITLILPTSDFDMSFLTGHREDLAIQGIYVLMSESLTVNTCLSKFKFMEICKANNIPIPNSYPSLKEIVYPCVGRLDASQASQGVFIIKSPKALQELLNKYSHSDIIFQEYINFPEYTIDAFFGSEGELVCAVPRRRIKVVNGESVISMTENIPELISLANRLSPSVFKFWGHITIQVFFDGHKIIIIEINPRFGGASNLSIKAGLNSPKWMLELISDKDAFIEVGKINYDLKMLRYSEDIFV